MTRLLSLCLFSFLLAGGSADSSAADSPERIPLWTGGAPGSVDRMHEPEKLDGTNVSNVHHPSITPYLPAQGKSTGTAILIAPGGGHQKLCLGHEGDALAQWFADHGIAAFVMRYRLCREPDSTYTLEGDAMDDTRRAIRTVRANAATWNIDPDRIGIVGFSAGGELAAYAGMNPQDGDASSDDPIERVSSRPDFEGLIYPGKSSTFTVKPGMPPAFIAFGFHDRDDISIGMAKVYLQYKQADVPCEMHVYSNAGHGFGFRPGTQTAAGDWPQRMCDWLIDNKLLTENLLTEKL
ncbi:Acetylxylan esterase precursor [Rubripirellula lacrimiformis]|uniref:Acetylxylan esterase n=1 Tax=Rubripirellula lacrimiformis TaxID=1930273 RepID=A0A517NAD4_9BACT|nr:alpha/beta hydrolase [Rubripirellula lacrimiformis]QDT04094.1 Acetylxylan esterase precursor [Rubripirellula lacrimiformis]